MLPETAVWQPPATIEAKGTPAKWPLGQVPGVAATGDGTLWLFHRGARAWNPNGTVVAEAGGAAGGSLDTLGDAALLPGPTVLQVRERAAAEACCAGLL